MKYSYAINTRRTPIFSKSNYIYQIFLNIENDNYVFEMRTTEKSVREKSCLVMHLMYNIELFDENLAVFSVIQKSLYTRPKMVFGYRVGMNNSKCTA